MKKTYQQPATRVVTIQQRHQLLTSSLTGPSNVGINNTVSSKASYARSFRGDWDWEDE